MSGGWGGPSRDVVDVAGLARGERVLASREVPGGWALATTHGLHVVALTGTSPTAVRAVRWTDVADATVVAASRTLDLRLVDGSTWSVALGARPGRLTQVVRDRVTNSVLLSRFVPVTGDRGVQVAVRRDPADRLFVQRVADDGVSLADRTVAHDVAEAEAALRVQTGLPMAGGSGSEAAADGSG